MAVILFSALSVLYYYFNTFISTDNAYVEAHIVYISPKVPGIVKNVFVKDNEEVKAGQILVEIDEKDYAVRLEKAEMNFNTNIAMAKRAEGELKAANDLIAVAGSNLNVAISQIRETEAGEGIALANLNLAEKDMQRSKELYNKEFATRKQLDDAETKKIMAQRELELAKSKVIGARAKKDAEEAQLKNLRTQAEVARLSLETAISRSEEAKTLVKEARITNDDTRLFSPANGIVGRKIVEIGQFVSPGQPLMAIVSTADIWIVANYKETQLTKVRAGMTVEIKADIYPDMILKGIVESLSPASGATFSLLPPENATGNFTKVVQRIPVRIKISGNERFKLKPGMSVKTTIDTRT